MSIMKIIESSTSLSELTNSINITVHGELMTCERVINTNYTFG